MLEIDIQTKSNGKDVINWEVDRLDRVLDGLNIYEGMCTKCYGKDNYGTKEEVRSNYEPIAYDPRHVHMEMLKTFAYLAKADGERILVRGFMENQADDFALLYQRNLEIPPFRGILYDNSVTLTSFGWRNLSFMSQVKLPSGTVESFPTMVHRAIAGADGEKDAAERWFAHLNSKAVHFTGHCEDFANLYRPYSQTPYTPEPGYILLVGEAGSPSSTGTTVSAFRLLGMRADQLLSPEMGRRTGSVEIDGEWWYHDGKCRCPAANFPYVCSSHQ